MSDVKARMKTDKRHIMNMIAKEHHKAKNGFNDEENKAKKSKPNRKSLSIFNVAKLEQMH